MLSEGLTIPLAGGNVLGYAQYGDPNGKPLFFFHGWPSSRLQAKAFHSVAKKLGIKLISFDRPGYGLSDFIPDRSLLDWPDTVCELADKLHIQKFSVIGVSGGGSYAVACAYKIPDRLTRVGIVAGLAPTYIPRILDGMPWYTRLGWANYGRFPILRTAGSLFHYLNTRYGPSLGLHRFFFGAKADKTMFADVKFRNDIKNNIKEAFRAGYRGAEMDLKLYTNHWGFDLQLVNTPVFLWYGTDDQNVPLAMGKYYASHLPKSTLKVYPNEGHLIMRTHTTEILQTLTT